VIAVPTHDAAYERDVLSQDAIERMALLMASDPHAIAKHVLVETTLQDSTKRMIAHWIVRGIESGALPGRIRDEFFAEMCGPRAYGICPAEEELREARELAVQP
jgi:hypothetical protein